ncbi:MAG: hypothetical protein G01um101413_561 [Parcubacteria group bacterium Gr01-1014_13]|nr:MAG: hypothetical protein G01um101413_561 [Parcubacteria group bacterium Gr01-1014_13]
MENTEDKNNLNRGFLVSYDQSMDIQELMKLSLNVLNSRNINYDITQEHFDKLSGVGIRTVSLRVEPYLLIETSAQAVLRLVAAGHTLANLKDLAAFIRSYPEEAKKWWWIFALSEDSWWAYPDNTRVVYANMQGWLGYTHWGLRDQVSSSKSDLNGILVLAESDEVLEAKRILASAPVLKKGDKVDLDQLQKDISKLGT